MSYLAAPIRPWPGTLLGSDTINRGLMADLMPSHAAGGGMVDIGPHKLHGRPGAAAVRTSNPRVGRALNFNGSTQYLTTRAPNAGGSTGPHTVVAWVRPNFSSASNAAATIMVRGAGVTWGQRLVWVNSTIGWYSDNLSAGTGAAFQTGAATPAFSAGEWHLVGFVYNGGGVFYWDGKPVATAGPLYGSWPNANLTGLAFYIGRDMSASQYWNGALGRTRQFTRGLHAAEMWRLYHRRSTGLARPRNASWWVGSAALSALSAVSDLTLAPMTGLASAAVALAGGSTVALPAISGGASAGVALAGGSVLSISALTGAATAAASLAAGSALSLDGIAGTTAGALSLAGASAATLALSGVTLATAALSAASALTLVITGVTLGQNPYVPFAVPLSRTVTLPTRLWAASLASRGEPIVLPARRRTTVLPPERS